MYSSRVAIASVPFRCRFRLPSHNVCPSRMMNVAWAFLFGAFFNYIRCFLQLHLACNSLTKTRTSSESSGENPQIALSKWWKHTASQKKTKKHNNEIGQDTLVSVSGRCNIKHTSRIRLNDWKRSFFFGNIAISALIAYMYIMRTTTSNNVDLAIVEAKENVNGGDWREEERGRWLEQRRKIQTDKKSENKMK